MLKTSQLMHNLLGVGACHLDCVYMSNVRQDGVHKLP